MGSAIYEFIKTENDVLVFDPYKVQENSMVKNVDSIQAIAQECEFIILAVKPGKIAEVVMEIESFGLKHRLISIAAGIKYSLIKSIIRQDSLVVRLMPNLPLTIGKGAIGYYGDKELYHDVIDLFAKMGMLSAMESEKLMDAFTALAGSGPAFVFSFIQALAEGGVKSGLTYQESLAISIETVIGSSLLLKNELNKSVDAHPIALRNKVTSPGGTTIYGLAEMESGGFNSCVINSVYAAYLRSIEMGK